MISQTDSFDKTEPVGVSRSVLKTFTNQHRIILHLLVYFQIHTKKLLLKSVHY